MFSKACLKSLAFVFLLLALDTATAQATKVDRIAAVVNEAILTQSDINQQINILKSQLNARGQPIPSQKILEKEALESLINTELQLQLAKLHNIDVDDDDVKIAIQSIQDRTKMPKKDFMERIKKQGLTYPRYQQKIRQELIINELQQKSIGSQVQVTEEEINELLAHLQSEQTIVNEYHVKNILVPLPETPTPEEVKQAKQQAIRIKNDLIKHPDTFSEIAMRVSSGGKALQGGDLGWRKLSELPSLFVKPIQRLQQNQLAGPIRAANGFHLLKLVDKRQLSPTQAPLPTRKQAEQMVYQRKFQEELFDWLRHLRGQAYIKIVKEPTHVGTKS